MKRLRLLTLVLVLTLSAACASLPLKQRATVSLQSSQTALAAAQDTERRICDPEKSAVQPPVSFTTCPGPLAKTVGLTDERHQAFAKALAAAFDLQIKTSQTLQAWQAGQPAPKTLEELRTNVSTALGLVQQLTPGNENVQSILARLQLAIDGVIDTIELLQGAN